MAAGALQEAPPASAGHNGGLRGRILGFGRRRSRSEAGTGAELRPASTADGGGNQNGTILGLARDNLMTPLSRLPGRLANLSSMNSRRPLSHQLDPDAEAVGTTSDTARSGQSNPTPPASRASSLPSSGRGGRHGRSGRRREQGTSRWPPPASARAIGALPRVPVSMHDIERNQNDCCTICLEQLHIGEFATRIPCGHLFHEDCIKLWLKSSNQCPVCRYELATDNKEYEELRRCRMQQRKLRFSMTDLKAKGVNELLRLTDHLGLITTGCSIKSDLVSLLASSEMVEIIEEEPKGASSPQNIFSGQPRRSNLSRAELAQRMAQFDAHAFGEAPATHCRDVPGSVHDIASQILAELRQTAASLDFDLNIELGAPSAQSSSRPPSGGTDNSAERRPVAGSNHGCLTTAGQAIVHCSACSGGA